MENKVGDKNPDAAATAKLVAELGGVVEALGKFCITLSKDERRRLLHARLGAEPHIARVHEMATKFGINLVNMPLAGMLSDLALYVMLRPIADTLRTALQMVEDTAGEAESEAWQAFLAYYGALAGVAKHHPEIATALAPTIEFMAVGSRSKGPSAAPNGSSPT